MSGPLLSIDRILMKDKKTIYTFTTGDLDAVLYGYIRSQEGNSSCLHSLSGVRFAPPSFLTAIPGILTPTSPAFPGPLSPHCNWSPSFATGRPGNEQFTFSEKTFNLPSCFTVKTMYLEGLFHIGVFCREEVPKGARFGPFTGRIVHRDELDIRFDNTFTWEVFGEKMLHNYIDGSTDPYNWLKLVNCARHKAEQNMILFQNKEQIFYELCRDVKPGEELLVWYGPGYEKYLELPVTFKEPPVVIEEPKTASKGSTSTEDMKETPGTYPCDRCGKVFSYMYYREKHLKYTRCVDLGNRKFPCHLCQRSFEKRDRLRIHILHVHQKHRPHVCNVCGKRFSQSSSLNKHQRVHSGERPYKCPHCIKAFTASSILRTHLRQHSGERPFKCKHCGKAFASHAAHDSHVRRTHTKQKPCVCHICGKAFAQAYELKFHVNIHTGDKPYSCDKCGRKFSSPSSRDRHRLHFDCTSKVGKVSQLTTSPKKDNNNNNEMVGDDSPPPSEESYESEDGLKIDCDV